jgi:hypothetical protein
LLHIFSQNLTGGKFTVAYNLLYFVSKHKVPDIDKKNTSYLVEETTKLCCLFRYFNDNLKVTENERCWVLSLAENQNQNSLSL